MIRASSVQTIPMRNGKVSLAKMNQCKNCQKNQFQLVNLRREVGKLTQKLQQEEKKNIQLAILSQQIEKTKEKLVGKIMDRHQNFHVLMGLDASFISRKRQSSRNQPNFHNDIPDGIKNG